MKGTQVYQPKAVIFDTDNTLYPYDYANQKAMASLMERAARAYGLDRNEFLEAFGKARAAVKKQLGATASSHSRLLYIQKALELMDLQSQVLMSLDLEQAYWGTFLRNSVLFPGVREFISLLRRSHVKTAIITDLTAQIQFRKLVYFDLENSFDYVVTSEEAGADKPSRIPFDTVLKKLDVSADQAWMIGDNPVSDIDGANACGIKSFQKIHAGVKQGRPFMTFEHYDKISEYFRRIG